MHFYFKIKNQKSKKYDINKIMNLSLIVQSILAFVDKLLSAFKHIVFLKKNQQN